MSYQQAWEQARATLKTWRQNGEQIVFTNGCFDLLHPGHIDYLEQARKLGDRLVIGLNDDASIRKLKGSSRPINPMADRITMLSALRAVDLVVPFAEETPLALITLLQPQILVKGGDYQLDQIVGADVVRATGGHVTVIPFLDGYSSSSLIQRIRTDPC